MILDAPVKVLKEYMDQSSCTVAVTGAGISYNYGMRRLKSQTSRMDLMRYLSPEYVKKHPEEFYALMKDSFLDATFEKGPGPVHKALVKLQDRGKLYGIVTQNMDGLHTLAGSQNVVEFMGGFSESTCVDCGYEVHDINVWNKGHAPRCKKCGAPLMPSHFDRNAPSYESESKKRMQKAAEMVEKADLLLIIGTTGFRSEEYLTRLRSETKIVQINPGSTVFDEMADLNIKSGAEDVLAQIVKETA